MGSASFRSLDVDGFCVTNAWFPPGLRLPPHTHDRASFAVMIEGSFDVRIAGRTHECPSGFVITEPVAERHGNRVYRAGARVVVAQPQPDREDLGEACGHLLDRVRHFRHPGIAALASRLARELEAPDAVTPLAVEAGVLEMLALAARLDGAGGREGRPPGWLDRVRDLLHARFLDRLRTADLAREAGVHPVHLARVFRAHVGVPVGEYVRTLRLDWAARRIVSTQDRLSDIAVDAGFADQSHFTRAFRRHAGETPARLRRRTPSPDRAGGN